MILVRARTTLHQFQSGYVISADHPTPITDHPSLLRLDGRAAVVRVNGVAPGIVRTPRLSEGLGEDAWDAVAEFVSMGRATEPSEIASVILFLASDLSSHRTGQTLVIDGGLTGHLALPKRW